MLCIIGKCVQAYSYVVYTCILHSVCFIMHLCMCVYIYICTKKCMYAYKLHSKIIEKCVQIFSYIACTRMSWSVCIISIYSVCKYACTYMYVYIKKCKKECKYVCRLFLTTIGKCVHVYSYVVFPCPFYALSTARVNMYVCICMYIYMCTKKRMHVCRLLLKRVGKCVHVYSYLVCTCT